MPVEFSGHSPPDCTVADDFTQPDFLNRVTSRLHQFKFSDCWCSMAPYHAILSSRNFWATVSLHGWEMHTPMPFGKIITN